MLLRTGGDGDGPVHFRSLSLPGALPFDFSLKRGQRLVPQPVEPCSELPQPVGIDEVEPAGSVGAFADQSRLPQHFEMWETAGRLTGNFAAIAPTGFGPLRSSLKMRRRVGSAKQRAAHSSLSRNWPKSVGSPRRGNPSGVGRESKVINIH